MALLLFVCVLFWGAHKSLAPRARTLLGVLGHATVSFFVVATLLFFSFCECPKFSDLAKQRRKIFWGVSEVGKDDFSLFFFLAVRLFLGFFFCFAHAILSFVIEASPSVAGGGRSRVNLGAHSPCWEIGATHAAYARR